MLVSFPLGGASWKSLRWDPCLESQQACLGSIGTVCVFRQAQRLKAAYACPSGVHLSHLQGTTLSMVAPCKLNRKTPREGVGSGLSFAFSPTAKSFFLAHMLRPSQKGLCRRAGDSGHYRLTLSEGTGKLQQVLYTQDDVLWQELRAPARKPTDRPQARLNAAGL